MAEINERQDKPEGEIPADEIRRRKAVMFANRSLKNKRFRFSKRSRDTGFITAAASSGIRHEEKALDGEPQHRVKAPRKDREKHTENSSVRDEKLRRRAAYIKEMISQEKNIANHTEEYVSDAASSGETLTKNETERRKDETENSAEHGSHRIEDRNGNAEHRVISPEIAERMKKAAYIKLQLERKLTEERLMSSYSDDDILDIPTSEKHGVSDDRTVTYKEASKPYEGRFIGNSERYEIESSSEYRRKTAIKQAYEKAIIRRRNNIQAELRRRDAETQTAAAITAERNILSANMRNSDSAETERSGVNALLAENTTKEYYHNNRVSSDNSGEYFHDVSGTVLAEKTKFRKYADIGDGLVSSGEFISEYSDAVQSGDAARLSIQPAAKLLRNNSGSSGKAVSDVGGTVSSVERSDSIGSAIMDISAVLAINETKKRFMNILKGKAPEEQKQRVEHRKSKKYHYVDGDENGGRFADRIEQLKKNSFKEKLAKE
ncbi:MAG: hypothetical protein K6C13_03180, partial [Oscillospiraceae bacterium]|nr:hypothetical protein [Oscillospiraceae bacterium]